MIKTIALTGGVQEVKFAGRHQYFHVHNLGGSEVLVSLDADVVRGKDGVLIIPGGGAGYVQVDAAADTVYLSGSGEVQVVAAGNAFAPFKSAVKGGGESGELTTNGGTLTGTIDCPIIALHLYGKSVQDGTPTPDAPIDVASVGDDGAIIIAVDNGGDITLSAEITSGLPLREANGERDELIYNADGTGKIIKRTAKKRVVADGSLHHDWQAGAWGINDFFADGVEIPDFLTIANYYCNYAPFDKGADGLVSTPGAIGVAQGGGKKLYFRFSSEHTTHDAVTNYLNNNEIYIVYQLATPQEIELSADEMAALMQLQTFEGVTNIYNDENAEMSVKIATDPIFSELIKPILDGYGEKIEALAASLEAFADKAVTTIGTKKLVLSGRTSTSETSVSFTKKFATTPNVAIAFAPSSISSGYIYSAHVSDVSTTSFKIGKRALYSSDASTVNGTVYWIAIGEEAAE